MVQNIGGVFIQKLADRQLAAQTCEKSAESCFRQAGSRNRLILFGFSTPTAPLPHSHYVTGASEIRALSG